MRNRLAVVNTGICEDRRLFTELIEGLWKRAVSMVSDSRLESCGREWVALAEGTAAVLAELADWKPDVTDYKEGKSDAAWWERATGAGFRVITGEREVHPAGRRGVAALETAFLFGMMAGFTGDGGKEPVDFEWQDGAPAVSGDLPGGGTGVFTASRRGGEVGGLGMIIGMVRRPCGREKPELVLEAILPTTVDRVLAIRLVS